MDKLQVGVIMGRLRQVYQSMREEGDNDMRTVVLYLDDVIDQLKEL